MRPDHEITEGIRLGVIAVLSAVVTATVVIGAGRALMPEAGSARAAAPLEAPVVRAALR